MSNSFYRTLIQAGGQLGILGPTARTLRSANGTRIGVSGCSNCVVSFLGQQVEFPILVCDLAAGTDAIIGADVLGSVLPHTLDIKHSLLFIEGGASLQLHRRDSIGTGVYSWPLFDSSIFRSNTTLLGKDYRWPPYAIKWTIRRINLVCGKYGFDCRQNTVEPVAMEGTGSGFEFWPGHHRSGAVLGGRNDSTSFGNTDSLPFSYDIWTYFLLRGPPSLDIQMPLSMKLTLGILRPYVAHPAGCPPRR